MNTQIRKKILNYLRKEKVMTSSELAKHLKVSWNTAEKYLLELVIEGEIIKIKKLGVNLWLKK
jgi:DeoR/GlpR family transcriptional regulator of sugar metabolism